MIIVFYTYGGLCNQCYDILYGINFCLANNLQFTFRYASFRNSNLTSWSYVNFDELFSTDFLQQFQNYTPISIHNITEENTFNYDGKQRTKYLPHNDNLYDYLQTINKPYIVLSHFHSYGAGKPIINGINIIDLLKPSNKIYNKYIEIKNKLFPNNENYNLIHYRYEHDFTNHFHLIVPPLNDIINSIHFKNTNIILYIASSNAHIISMNIMNVIYKDENELIDFNFEQKAYIDFLFGLNSVELYGAINSTFSVLLNRIKKTNNYYAL